MKLAYRAVESFLRVPDSLHRACLVYGPDSGLVRERCWKIREAVLGKDADPFAFAEIDPGRLLEDPALLADEIRAVQMLAPKRLIFIRDAGDKLTRIIEDSAEYFHPEAFLLVAADELPTRSSLRAWFEKSENCAALACYRDEARDVQEVIRKTFGEAGLRADSEVVEYLSTQLGNDRYVTYQELQKIVLFAGETKTISLPEAQALVDYNRDTGLDDVVLAAADRDIGNLERVLQLAMREHTSPVSYLRALQRYFNRLYLLRSKADAGSNVDELIKSLRPPVFFKQVPALTRHVHGWALPQIIKALKLLVSAELACKTSDLPPLPASGRKLFQLTQLR